MSQSATPAACRVPALQESKLLVPGLDSDLLSGSTIRSKILEETTWQSTGESANFFIAQ